MKDLHLLRTHTISNKRVIVRVDFDVPLEDGKVVDDTRITANIPTLKKLLDHGNSLVLIGKLGRPQGRDPKLSMKIVADLLPDYLPGYTVTCVDDFMKDVSAYKQQKKSEIILLENIRYYTDEVRKSPEFLDTLCTLGKIYVNDAFAMSHRDEPTITGIPQKMPGYAGLLLEKEIHSLQRITQNAKKPVVAIIGGAKIETKVEPIKKLLTLCDNILIGGGIANTFLKAHGYEVGDSLYEDSEIDHAKEIIRLATTYAVDIELPIDARIGDPEKKHHDAHVVPLPLLPKHGHILDIGPRTEEMYAEIISQAQTIFWNGPMGMFEIDEFKCGTDEIYRAVIHTTNSYSVVGGGDTLAALARKRQKHGIDHISTGGGAMLHYIQHDDLPGLRALRESAKKYPV